MEESEEFYMENGLMVFTAAHHLKRGHCCKNKCRHCPWNYGKSKDNKGQELNLSANLTAEQKRNCD